VLGEISGIGPAKLEKYGDAVLHLVAENSAEIEPAPEIETVVEGESEPQISPPVSPDSSPLNAILTVVSDLDGLLTAHGLALLLTAAPDDIVSFSDHNLFGTFHGNMTPEEMEEHIQQAIQACRLSLSAHQRILLNDDQNL